MEFLNHTLSNGLQIVAECNPEAHSTALAFFVQTGARDEHDGIAGVSHFLEHMVFKGTPRRTADEVNREFDEMGAHYNAMTGEENTVYYAFMLPECQDRAVALLADILRPSLREDDFETEKKVILEEIKMYDDQPPFGADEKCRASFFGDHPLGRSVLGTAESVGGLTPEAMRDYFERRYSPANVTLGAAGKVNFPALVRCVEENCGHWPARAASRTVTTPTVHEGFQTLIKESASQQYLLQMASGPAAEDADRYAAKLLAVILGDESGSRLFWELVDPGLAEHATIGHGENQGAGVMVTYVCCDPARAKDNLDRVNRIYRQAEKEGITEAELGQAKSKVRSRVVLGSERPRGRLFTIGGDWVYRREYRPLEKDLDALAALTRDDVHAVLAKYPLTRNTTLTIGPRE
ncbi:MAG: insulinase family protein [Pirellulales bacterium]|nr:insulinase family protein [Pirellulales bacterium]